MAAVDFGEHQVTKDGMTAAMRGRYAIDGQRVELVAARVAELAQSAGVTNLEGPRLRQPPAVRACRCPSRGSRRHPRDRDHRRWLRVRGRRPWSPPDAIATGALPSRPRGDRHDRLRLSLSREMMTERVGVASSSDLLFRLVTGAASRLSATALHASSEPSEWPRAFDALVYDEFEIGGDTVEFLEALPSLVVSSWELRDWQTTRLDDEIFQWLRSVLDGPRPEDVHLEIMMAVEAFTSLWRNVSAESSTSRSKIAVRATRWSRWPARW